jgi:hypothetical protein
MLGLHANMPVLASDQGKRKSGIVLVDPLETLWDTMKRFGNGVDRVMVRMDSDAKGMHSWRSARLHWPVLCIWISCFLGDVRFLFLRIEVVLVHVLKCQ